MSRYHAIITLAAEMNKRLCFQVFSSPRQAERGGRRPEMMSFYHLAHSFYYTHHKIHKGKLSSFLQKVFQIPDMWIRIFMIIQLTNQILSLLLIINRNLEVKKSHHHHNLVITITQTSVLLRTIYGAEL